MLSAKLLDGKSTIKLEGAAFASGAMKDVYRVAGRRTPGQDEVACFYKQGVDRDDPNRRERLENILGKFNPTVPKSLGGAALDQVEADFYKSYFCWPTALVSHSKLGLGFLAPFYPAEFKFPDDAPEMFRGKDKEGVRFFGRMNRKLLSAMCPQELGSWDKYLIMCIRTARAVARLNNAGLAHSDLSFKNVLVNPRVGTSIVIDIDSLVVPGLYPPDVLGTAGYFAPEVLATSKLAIDDPNRKHPSIVTDQHALAVLIYQFLLLRHPLDGRRIVPATDTVEQDRLTMGEKALYCEHPTDPANRPENFDSPGFIPASSLGPHLNDLFKRAFVDGLHRPQLRPSALEWLGALTRTRDLLFPCPGPHCWHKWFVFNPSNPGGCPSCGARPKGEFLLLQLRHEVRPGVFGPDGLVIGFDKLRLYRWHAFDNVNPGPGVGLDVQAEIQHDPAARRWVLLNRALPTLTSSKGNPVPIGRRMSLDDNSTFRTDEGPHARIIEVKHVRI